MQSSFAMPEPKHRVSLLGWQRLGSGCPTSLVSPCGLRPHSPSKYDLLYRDQAMETTTNSIAACAASMRARGRFGYKSTTSVKYLNFKPNQQLVGIKSALIAIEFVVNEGKS
jgi:hypothetical protein